MEKAMEKLLKYELKPQVVKYLFNAVNTQQIRGEKQAQDLMAVLQLLRTPSNKEELEKKSLEELKSKYETEDKKKK